MKKNPRNLLVALSAIVVLLGLGIGARVLMTGGGQSGPSIGGPFRLVNHEGYPVSEADYAGRHMLVFFGYTFCPDVCPTALGTVAEAMNSLSASQAAEVAPLFISVDPARDTPAVLKDYVKAFHPSITGLTGSEEQVAATMKTFKVYAAKVKSGADGSYTMDHSAILYLMGPKGEFLAHFPHGTTASELAESLKKRL